MYRDYYHDFVVEVPLVQLGALARPRICPSKWASPRLGYLAGLSALESIVRMCCQLIGSPKCFPHSSRTAKIRVAMQYKKRRRIERTVILMFTN